MRKDMAKVIVERPRVNDSYDGWRMARRPKSIDIEELPFREATKAHKGGSKQLNENLAPLYRFLQSRCGKRWDDVHSEISEHLKLSTAVQKHVLDHLKQMVSLNTYHGTDGQIWVQNKSVYPIADTYMYREFYVDPEGFLRMAKRKPRRRYDEESKVEALKTRRDISKLVQYHKINGIWYEVRLVEYKTVKVKHTFILNDKTITQYVRHAETPDGRRHSHVPNMFGEYITLDDHHKLGKLYGRAGVFAVGKSQLSRKQLKRAGLRNDPA